MAKISRPVIYVAVLGVIAYAAVVLTEPDAPAKKVAPRTAKTTVTAPKGYTEEDLKASFPRYLSKEKDAFKPVVVAKQRSLPGTAPAGGALPGNLAQLAGLEKGVWLLTGVTSVNGVRSALVENGSTGESIFLKPGTVWKGLRVAAVESDAVVLVGPQGAKTRLAFAQFADEIKPSGVAPVIITGPGANVRTPNGQMPVLTGATPVVPGVPAAPAAPSPARTNSRPSDPSSAPARELPLGTSTADNRNRSENQP